MDIRAGGYGYVKLIITIWEGKQETDVWESPVQWYWSRFQASGVNDVTKETMKLGGKKKSLTQKET